MKEGVLDDTELEELPEPPQPDDWNIAQSDDGSWVAVGVDPCKINLLVESGGRTFKRRAIRWPGGRQVTILVGELDGVRLYYEHGKLILSRQDLYP